MKENLKLMNVKGVKFKNLSAYPYNPELFTEVKNDELGFVKPKYGGLWAVLSNTKSWYNYCKDNNFEMERCTWSNIFSLKSDSKILEVKSIEDLNIIMETYYLFNNGNPNMRFIMYKDDHEKIQCKEAPEIIHTLEYRKANARYYYLDFEKLSKEYDGIYVHNGPYFYFNILPYSNLPEYSLYSWDVPSLLLFNKDCIESMETKLTEKE